MEPEIEALLKQVYDTHTGAVITVAGGGASAIGWVQSVPGASRTLLKASVPYHGRALEEALGSIPEQAVSEEVALILAERGFHEARRLAGPKTRVIGLGSTAALATDRPRRGSHRCHLASMGDDAAILYSLELAKGERTRAEEEAVVSRLLVRALAQACGLGADLSLGLVGHEEVNVFPLEPLVNLRPFLDGKGQVLVVPPKGAPYLGAPSTVGILSGSFNPLHRGHRELAEAAARTLRGEVAYELPVVNADKPPLCELQVRRRAAQFSGWGILLLTRAPTFAEKAELLPGCVFIVGVDTAQRILDSRFYGGSEEGVKAALATVRSRGCHFLVAGRVEEGGFRTLVDLPIPPGFADLFEAIPEADFRADVSSTALRREIVE